MNSCGQLAAAGTYSQQLASGSQAILGSGSVGGMDLRRIRRVAHIIMIMI